MQPRARIRCTGRGSGTESQTFLRPSLQPSLFLRGLPGSDVKGIAGAESSTPESRQTRDATSVGLALHSTAKGDVTGIFAPALSRLSVDPRSSGPVSAHPGRCGLGVIAAGAATTDDDVTRPVPGRVQLPGSSPGQHY